jgi:hypothetical protein
MDQITPPTPPHSSIDTSWGNVKRTLLGGGVFDERKRLRGNNGQYRTVSPEQKTLAKVIGNVKFNASITRPGIKTELYTNLSSAFERFFSLLGVDLWL